MLRRLRFREKLWLAPVAIITACFVVPFYLLMILVGIPFFLVSCWHNEREYRQRMQSTGRVLEWNEAVGRAREGRGLLLVQVVPPGAMARVWWAETNREEIDPGHELPDMGIHAGTIPIEKWEAMRRIGQERLRGISTEASLVRVPIAFKFFQERLRRELVTAGALAVMERPRA